MLLASLSSTTMTVHKELSVVADSTCSPCSSSPAVKQRASPAYDCSKTSDDADTSLIYPPLSLASRDSTYRTGPPDLDENVPPSSFSDNELADDENEDCLKEVSRGGDFFGWRKRVREFDKQDDSDVEQPDISATLNTSPSERPVATQFSSPQGDPSAHIPTSQAVVPLNALAQGVLKASRFTLTASSLPQSILTARPSPSSPEVIQVRRRFKKRVVHDSNSDSEPADDNGSPANTSPVFPHSISTPKSRSSPTPPTSDNDAMSPYPIQGYNAKGKGKVGPASSRPTVPPLQFFEGPNDLTAVSKRAAHKDKRKKKTKIKVRYPKPRPYWHSHHCSLQQRKNSRRLDAMVLVLLQTNRCQFLAMRTTYKSIPSSNSSPLL